ncbi:hypothetical protein CLV98_1316 [Dyadobacter jejuensis]|uniref:Uncharacterized protein n=1 Tax=Dyadobacter jejuensis TaxID=1082580 RepID=A0A316A5U1_9BACT|nr:hypothetical protein [Dyadobacter jejuensis]PWJ52852.1 hypothetical protein CLV98_1316 [Dyadobacter jejuensis]
MILCRKFKALIDEGRNQIADTMKTLVYNEMPSIFEFVDFENDRFFLDPLLFAYFNRGALKFKIENLLYGYMKKKPISSFVEITSDNDMIYLPELGYYCSGNNKINLSRSVDEPCLLLRNGIDVFRHQHVLLKDRFINSGNHKAVVEVTEATKRHYLNLQEASPILKPGTTG